MPSKFDFISPDIVLREVDQSQLPTIQDVSDPGVVIIGQSSFGPSMKPIRVDSILKLEETFGEPKDGSDSANDIWRSGNNQLPQYGLFAAKAWLSTNISPVTFIRLSGEDSPTQGGGYVSAGWNTGEGINAAAASNSSAYGLFVLPSASAGTTTGTLAAIIYAKNAALSLTGTIAGTASTTTSSAGVFINSDATQASFGGFELQIDDGTTTTTKKFHLDSSNQNGFIRDVLNTNPQLINAVNVGTTEKYFLGETFETEVFETLTTAASASAGKQVGILLPLASGSYAANNLADHNREAAPAKTGWFISRDPSPKTSNSGWESTDMKKLFRLVSLHDGKDFQDCHSVRIKDLKLGTTSNPDSTFTVEIVNHKSGDGEQFSNCNLNESSDNFIGKKIGDQFLEWVDASEKYVLKGDYENKSNLVRVEMASDWKAGIDDEYAIPFGFYGPAKLKGFTMTSGSAGLNAGSTTAYVVSPSASAIYAGHDAPSQFVYMVSDVTASIVYPEFKLTTENTNGAKNYPNTEYFGVRQSRSTLEESSIMAVDDYRDLAFPLGNDLDIHVPEVNANINSSLEVSFIFTLDEIKQDSTDTTKFYYAAGSRANGTSYTTTNGTSALISQKVKQFAAPFFGGTNGVDITLTDPFSSVSGQAITNSTTKTKHYAHYSVEKAIDMIKDPEIIEYDVVAVPGLVNTSLRKLLIRNTEARGDALAIVDPSSGFKQTFENNGSIAVGDVSTAVTDIETNLLTLDSSYAACYYPPVKLGTPHQKARMPSSVVGIGVVAQSEQASGAPWFAPAGFNRGGISTLGGASGIKVASSVETLNKADRDDLYQANINPIARFPNEGLVVFGQKTLQQTPSALDRVNVRRLMIYLKKRIGAVARTILFDNNLNATWNRFKSDAEPILIDAQSRFGISEFQLILDETTTTPDYIDRNILYAKVFIKPAYAIEFIAIDFNITRSGIEF